MRKSDKKIENKLRVALTEVCDFALDNISGYQWISHTVNYDVFPASLQVTCTFSSQQAIDDLKQSQQDLVLKKEITKTLSAVGIKIVDMNKQVTFIIE
ncbi:hypothetical protein, partial [Psychromonas sp. SP041]|uniref:hypothetical protein n=1 Tax=Psychromonas sp. SP041 TaxID=1365007 RepID=UPI0003F558A8